MIVALPGLFSYLFCISDSFVLVPDFLVLDIIIDLRMLDVLSKTVK